VAGGNGRYSRGYKYCSQCQAWFKTRDTYCPYCGFKMRATPRKRNRKAVKPRGIDPEALGVVVAPLEVAADG